MIIPLSEIQPGELFLRRPTVDFFLKNWHEIFRVTPPIRIGRTRGLPFLYYAIEGNNRLFVLYKLSKEIVDVDVENISSMYSDEYESNLIAYRNGIHTWEDLARRAVSVREYARLLNRPPQL